MLTAIVVVGILGTALSALVLHDLRAASDASSRDELLNVAESGAEAAISMLAAGARWRGERAVRVPGGSCSVSVASAGDGSWEITSRASAEDSARACTVCLRVKETATGSSCVIEWRPSFR